MDVDVDVGVDVDVDVDVDCASLVLQVALPATTRSVACSPDDSTIRLSRANAASVAVRFTASK